MAGLAVCGSAAEANGTDDRGKTPPRPAADTQRGWKGDDRSHDRRDPLTEILANQRRIIEMMETLQDTTLPNQQTVLESIARIQTDAVAEQALLIDQISGLELACSTPDLVPVALPGGGFCRLTSDGTTLQVPVYNQGGGAAGESLTSVWFRVPPEYAQYGDVFQVDMPTPALGGFTGSGLLNFLIPQGCFGVEGVCKFKIGVDAGLGALHVLEADETNNDAAGECSATIL
jgi:hypothetical protein